jgi:thiol-disulfide isomerase/thioredoxin
MIERVLIALMLLILCAVGYHLLRTRRLRRVRLSAPVDPLLMGAAPGVPVVVHFTTPSCAPCHLYIAPMLKQLQAEMSVHVIRVDATQDSDAAERWGVFSVPTVFVLDNQHQPRGVYHGSITPETLRRALQVA